MKWEVIIFIMALSLLPLASAELSLCPSPDKDFFGWFWCSISNQWENWFGGEVIETSLVAPQLTSNTPSSQIVLSSDIFTGYFVSSSTGLEGWFFKPIINDNQICFQVKTLSPYVGTTAISITSIKSVPIKTLDKNLVYNFTMPTNAKLSDRLCYSVPNPLDLLWMKFGIESIVIRGDTSYNSTNNNVTGRNGGAWLNISKISPYPNLRGYWNFDINKLTSFYDFSSYNYDGILQGNANTTSGIYGNYLDLPTAGGSSTDGGTVSNFLLSSTTLMTECAWVYYISDSTVITEKGSLDFSIGSVSFNTGTYKFEFGNSVIPNEWHHYCLTVDQPNNNASLYVDGTHYNSISCSAFNSDETNCVANGCTYSDPNCLMSSIASGIGETLTFGHNPDPAMMGRLDEIMIFNSILTPTQISNIYNNNSARFVNNGTMVFYKLDLGNNNTLNITLSNCKALFGSNLSAQINNNGSIMNFTNCKISNYPLNFSDTRNANLTIFFTSNANTFYTPALQGNIHLVLNDYLFPMINFTSPTPINGTNQQLTNIYVNISSSDSNQHFVVNNFDNSLVSWWRMDDINATGGVVDYMGRNNGTIIGGVTQIPSIFGNGMDFDGKSGYIKLGTGQQTSNYSIFAWVKDVSYNGLVKYIVTREQGSGDFNRSFKFGMSGYNSIHLDTRVRGTNYVAEAYPQGVYANPTGTTKGFIFVGVVWNGTGEQFYFNGMPIATATGSIPGVGDPTIPVLTMGADMNGANKFNGTLDELMIFNRTLSQSEILALYNATTSQYYNNFTNLGNGTHTFQSYAEDIGGNVNKTELRTINISTTIAVSDTVYPIFSNYQDNNASFIGLANATFNVSVINTNGTVWLTINNTNYTAFNSTGLNSWNLTILNLINNTYAYFWNAYGNGTLTLYNYSETKYYTVNNTPIDSTPPNWNNLRNFTIEANTSFSQSITAFDPSGIGAYVLNDTSTFTINTATGLITNFIELNITNTYYFNISVNDTVGNTATGFFWINVTAMTVKQYSLISFLYPNEPVPYVQLNKSLTFA